MAKNVPKLMPNGAQHAAKIGLGCPLCRPRLDMLFTVYAPHGPPGGDQNRCRISARSLDQPGSHFFTLLFHFRCLWRARGGALWPPTKQSFFDALAQALVKWVVAPHALEQLPAALALLTERSAMKNKEIRVSAGQDTATGVFDGFGEDGALILRLKDGEKKVVTVGDVFFHGYSNV